jgi:ubiquinone/menaquinone biosynthesis C-methylase UbiE
MQVAEILDLGPPEEDSPKVEPKPLNALDLGCGSAVWSCAMGFRDPLLQITAVDHEAALVAADSTANSIGLGERFQTQVGDLIEGPLEEDAYDMVVIAQRLHALAPDQIQRVLDRAHNTLRSGGKIVVIDSFRGPNRPALVESLETLRMQIQTISGEVPDLPEAQSRMENAGFQNVQFTFIAASRVGLGLMIGTKR